MDKLTARTVFHEIRVQPRAFDDDGGETSLENEDVTVSTPDISQRERSYLAPLHFDSDAEWDTDLETDGYESKMSYDNEDQTRQVYLAACRQFNIVPAHCFIKAINKEVMKLNFQGLGPQGTRAVATGLVMDRFIRHLYLAGNFIGHDGIRSVCDMLRENEYITHLDLSENDLDTYAAQVISSVFKENDTLLDLNLSGNNFKDCDAEYFGAMLNVGQFTGLRNLDLSHNDLGDTGAQILGHAIGDNETLTHINLAWNQIRRAGISCIAKGLGENNTLRVIDVTSNGVDNQGAEYLGKALVTNRKLKELNLTSNRVGLDGVVSLFKSIAKNDTLEIIRLTNNPITSQGPVVALTLLQQSDSSVLQELDIADACVPREFNSILQEVHTARPEFKVTVGGFMNARDMCKADVKEQTEAWKKDPVLVFINFIEDRKMKVFDMFKMFDRDKSCTVSRDEFNTGLTKIGCPLKGKEINHLLNILDVDKNGEIDLGEFIDGFNKHKRRLEKYSKYGSTSRVASATSRNSPQPSSVVPSRPSSSSANGPSSNKQPTETKQVTTNQLARALAAEKRSFLEPLSVQPPTLQTSFDKASDNIPDIVIAVPKSLTVT